MTREVLHKEIQRAIPEIISTWEKSKIRRGEKNVGNINSSLRRPVKRQLEFLKGQLITKVYFINHE